jgi:hypothetical protein
MMIVCMFRMICSTFMMFRVFGIMMVSTSHKASTNRYGTN